MLDHHNSDGNTAKSAPKLPTLKSRIRFRETQTNVPVPAIDHLCVKAMSDGPEWLGLHLEVGDGRGWQAEDLMVDGHVVGINLAEGYRVQIRNEKGRFMPVTLPAGSLWIIPEGCHFSIRHRAEMQWATIVINGNFLDSLLGRHHELRMCFGVTDNLLGFLYRALVSHLCEKGNSPALTESLVRGFVLALGHRHGVPASEFNFKGGGIAPHQLKALLPWIDKNLGTKFNVETLAGRIGISAAHFSREFKRSTGVTPWEHVVEMRLLRAMRLLKSGESGHSIADKTGFFDHAHLTRLFKQRFGVLPSSISRGCIKKN